MVGFISFTDPTIEDAAKYDNVNAPIKLILILFIIMNVITLSSQIILIYYRAGRSSILKSIG